MLPWERSITFEGVSLPGTAIAIDHLGLYETLPEMSEECSQWLWRFTICVGIPRTDLSENVLRHVSEALDLMARFRARLVRTIPAHFDGAFTDEVFDSWAGALRTMKEIAANQDRCTWEAPLRPGEPAYGQSPAEILANAAVRLERAIKKAEGRAG